MAGDAPDIRNLLDALPDRLADEEFSTLAEGGAFRLVRIVSTAHATPDGAWYDQDEDEWVMVLAGSAALRLADETEDRVLRPGDSLTIPAHTRHRVAWTDPDRPTVWLALHFR